MNAHGTVWKRMIEIKCSEHLYGLFFNFYQLYLQRKRLESKHPNAV